MNPFLLTPRERLTDWKAFRVRLTELPEPEQLAEVARYWAQAPVSKFAYDIEHPSLWPSAWEMISDGDWCENSIAIGMEFTLRLAGWSADRLEIVHLRDRAAHLQKAVLRVDGSMLLNLEYGQPCERAGYEAIDVIGWTGRSYCIQHP